MNKKYNPISIYVEGNVGAGKSTFLSLLKQYFDAQMVYEPYDLWQNIDGNNLLDQFFLDQKRWAFTIQTYVTTTRIDQLNTIMLQSKKDIHFVERSIYSGRYCFAQTQFEMGLLNSLEWGLYKKLWEREEQKFTVKPSMFIYLRTPVEICYKRIKSRGRGEEEPLSLDYLKGLDRTHDDWFIYGKGIPNELAKIPVLVLDNSQNLKENIALQQEYVQKIKAFINNI